MARLGGVALAVPQGPHHAGDGFLFFRVRSRLDRSPDFADAGGQALVAEQQNLANAVDGDNAPFDFGGFNLGKQSAGPCARPHSRAMAESR